MLRALLDEPGDCIVSLGYVTRGQCSGGIRKNGALPVSVGRCQREYAVGLAYELTPVKRSALRFCRRPARSGLTHGAACVVCCAGLMLVLAGVGLMSIPWMAVVGAVIFVQKVGPRPAIRSRGVATR